jgi:thiamine pyrophosphokinase
MGEKKCVIIGAGEFSGEIAAPEEHDLVIAADGGYARVRALGLKINAVIGDFDSLGYEPEHENVIRLSVEKDDTDTLAAIRYGLDNGCREFDIYGGTGGRISHTIANIECLAFLSQLGARARLFGNGFYITAVTDGKIEFNAGTKGKISVFSHGDKAEGVYLEGLKYPLRDATLLNTFPLGVSNSFIGAKSSVRVERGTLIVVCEENES